MNQDQENDESLNGQNEYGWTQLHYAAFKGDDYTIPIVYLSSNTYGGQNYLLFHRNYMII